MRDLTLPALKTAYASGELTPAALVQELHPLLGADPAVWTTQAPLEHLLERAKALEALPVQGPLYGVPFAVKDNIDALPYPSTAACPAFEYIPTRSAPVVQSLLDAGAIMVGKTNMDQFAAGLVGTRTPYGVAANAFDDRFVPGGSSSGSGAAVGAGLVTFALGTDTAGSGRIPAGFNGCVGIKPTVGRLSTTGVVPACASLDCVSVFAQTVEDGAAVVSIAQAGTIEDPNWRPPPPSHAPRLFHRPFTFAVPGSQHLDFSGPGGDGAKAAYEALFDEAISQLQKLGGELVEVDFSAFATTAAMLYTSAFLAERYQGIRSFLDQSSADPAAVAGDSRLVKVTRTIISGAGNYSAADLYQAYDELRVLKGRARVELQKAELLVVPTALHHYTVAEVLGQEEHAPTCSWQKNGNLGRFTNFVNLLDMCALAVPSGLLAYAGDGEAAAGEVAARQEHLAATGNPHPILPFGITLIGPAWSDELLWGLGQAYVKATGLANGPAGHGVTPYRTPK